jgi:hypothetical protein
MKNRIIIWGGNKKDLILKNLDSHASVSAFFLTKYLSKYYEVINLVDMDSPEKILQYSDIIAVISTFQKGFTNRLVNKGKADLFYKIRRQIRGKLCSIFDYNHDGRYYEDIIFTVRQPNSRNIGKIKKKSYNPDMVISRMGWSADPDFCCPMPISKEEINVFIDHPPYFSKALDCTIEYYKAFKAIKRNNPQIVLNLFQQGNNGITVWNFNDDSILGKSLYLRKNKVPWAETIGYYRKMHIFCITHPESACLSAIEAAMCGAKLYIPKDRWNRLFIKEGLLREGMSYSRFRCSSKSIVAAFLEDMKEGFCREKIHKNISETNSWKLGAERIHEQLLI